MKIRTFSYSKGIALPRFFTDKADSTVIEFSDPEIFYVPLLQHVGNDATPVVEVGEKVKRGGLIAKSSQMNIFSPCSGVVRRTAMLPSALGGIVNHIVIENDFKNTTEKLPEIKKLNAVSILKRIFEAGIVDADQTPLFKKLIIEKGSDIKGIIINGCSDEPYITTSRAILNNYGEQVIAGAKIIAIALDIENIIFAQKKSCYAKTPNFTKQLIKANEQFSIEKNKINIKQELFADRYPMGDEHELLYALTKKRIPFGENAQSLGYIVIDLKCLLSVYSAVVSGQSDYMSLVTLFGSDKRHVKHCWIKSGIKIDYIAEQSVERERQKTLVKVVAGGPMRGVALSDSSVSTHKGMSALMFLTDDDVYINDESNCINCGECVKVCPRNLMPNKIDHCFGVKDFVGAHKFGATYCSECGCCAYVCPAKRHLVQRISISKDEIIRRGINKWR